MLKRLGGKSFEVRIISTHPSVLWGLCLTDRGYRDTSSRVQQHNGPVQSQLGGKKTSGNVSITHAHACIHKHTRARPRLFSPPVIPLHPSRRLAGTSNGHAASLASLLDLGLRTGTGKAGRACGTPGSGSGKQSESPSPT